MSYLRNRDRDILLSKCDELDVLVDRLWNINTPVQPESMPRLNDIVTEYGDKDNTDYLIVTGVWVSIWVFLFWCGVFLLHAPRQVAIGIWIGVVLVMGYKLWKTNFSGYFSEKADLMRRIDKENKEKELILLRSQLQKAQDENVELTKKLVNTDA